MSNSSIVIPFSEKDILRFWSKVAVRGPDECWPWLGGTAGKRRYVEYGSFRMPDRAWYAHRVSWVIKNGKIRNPKMVICHRCDNGMCVNPRHLFIGSQLINIRDMINKGRQHTSWERKGTANANCKLTEASVMDIRVLHAKGRSRASLGRQFGVSFTQINMIVKGKCWPHLPVLPSACRTL